MSLPISNTNNMGNELMEIIFIVFIIYLEKDSVLLNKKLLSKNSFLLFNKAQILLIPMSTSLNN